MIDRRTLCSSVPRRRTGSVALRRGAVIVAVVATVLAGTVGTAAAEAPPPGDSELDISGTTITGPGVSLRGSYFFPNLDEDTATPVPPASSIGPSSRNNWREAGTAPNMGLHYEILDASGKSTGFWIKATFDDPLIGYNEAQCSVYQGDPFAYAPVAAAAPFSCVWSNTSGYNPSPSLTVSAATVVTDKQATAQLLGAACRRPNHPHCVFADVVFTNSTGPEKQVGDYLVNDTNTEEANEAITWEYTVSESNTLEIASATQVALSKIVSETVTVTYSHTWETSHTFGETTSVSVAPHHKAWLTHAPSLQTATGRFVVVDPGGGNYLSKVVPNAAFTTPLPNGTVRVYDCALKADGQTCMGGSQQLLATTAS